MIETILTSLAFGTIWFWLLASIASIIIISCVEHEHYPTPSIVAILLGIIYWKQIVAAPGQVIAAVIGVFVLAGLFWSVFKWFRYVNKTTTHYSDLYGNTLTDSQMRDLKSEISVSQHKAMVTSWIMFWPWSLLWALTGDFFNMLYEAMTNIYQKITDHGLSKFSIKKKEVVTDSNSKIHRDR